MKKLLIVFLIPVFCHGQVIKFSGQPSKILTKSGERIKLTPIGEQNDSIVIHQDVFFSFGVYHLLTSDRSLYDNVIHGYLQFIETQKPIELNKALARRKPIVIVKAKCKVI